MRGRRYLVRGTLLGVVASLLSAGPAGALEVGKKAPNFALMAPGNKQVKLADLLGKGPVVIYTFGTAFAAV